MAEIKMPWERARDRVDYKLAFDGCDSRAFEPEMLLGPDIPNAYGEGMSGGDWSGGTHLEIEDMEVTEADWLAAFASMAVSEAVHEALEWFQVDGTSWLDPHGKHESAIIQLVERLTNGLADLVAKGGTDG